MDQKVTEPGLYHSVDKEQLARLEEQYESMLEQNREQGQKWGKNRNDYQTLRERLTGLCDKATHQVLVPVGKKAFMPGTLVHTNEITVLLGDNWFAERSTKQANEICERRLKKCDEMLADLAKELELVKSWQMEADQMRKDRDRNNLEIREPYDPKTEREWRVKHKENVRKAKLAEKEVKNVEKIDEDQKLWDRLDELEMEEELEAHLEEERKKSEAEEYHKALTNDVTDNEDEVSDDDDSEDWSESPPLTDDEEEIRELSSKLKRKVSFGENQQKSFDKNEILQKDLEVVDNSDLSEREPLCLIEFSHSEEETKRSNNPDPFLTPEQTMTPADLMKSSHMKKSENVIEPKQKSILKPFDPQTIPVMETLLNVPQEEVVPVAPAEPFRNPVADSVVEKVPLSTPELAGNPCPPPNVKKMSRFKQSRLK